MINRRDVILSLSAATVSGLVTAAPVSIDHSEKVYPVDQGSADLCWLALGAMLMSEARGLPVTMQQLAGALRGMGKSTYDAKSPMTVEWVEPFAKALKLRTDGVKSMAADVSAKLLLVQCCSLATRLSSRRDMP